MRSKLISYLLLAVLLVTAIVLVRKNRTDSPVNQTLNTTTRDEPYLRRGFNRTVSYLEYTRHARCRMDCRHITKEEVEDILVNGSINYHKSDLQDRPCPTYALEGYTHKDNQHVRIVFAQCDNKTKVVTCIDLDNDFACDCR